MIVHLEIFQKTWIRLTQFMNHQSHDEALEDRQGNEVSRNAQLGQIILPFKSAALLVRERDLIVFVEVQSRLLILLHMAQAMSKHQLKLILKL